MKKLLLIILLLSMGLVFAAWSIYGDVNGDGDVTAADVTALYDFLLNGDASNMVNGDQNGDGNVTASDITAVYDELLNGAGDEYDADYKMVNIDLDSYLAAHADATYSQIQQYLHKYGSKVSTSIVDDVLYVMTRDGRSIQIDLYGSFVPSESTEGEVDDSEMYQLLDDIEAALGNPGGSKASDVTVTSSIGTKSDEDDEHLYASETGQKRVLTRRNILLWSPWSMNQDIERKELKEIAKANKLSYNEIVNKECTLASMANFSDYDIVVLACHGTKRGELVLPKYADESYDVLDKRYGKKGYSMAKVKYDGEFDNCVVLSYSNVKKNLPKLSKTILWTLMCHAYAANSEIKQLADDANAADFYGATNEINAPLPLGYLKKFTPLFYNGSTSEKSFLSIANKRSIDYTFTDNLGTVEGKYCMRALRDVVYQKPRAIEANGKKPRGVVRIDPSMANAVGIQYTRSPKNSNNGSSDVEAGFWFKHTSSGEEFVLPFTQQHIEILEVTNYGDYINQYIIEGNTAGIGSDNYLYRTYIRIDGNYYYSDETYNLNIGGLCPDNNHPHAIDLGLPSGTKWACCNIGADSPTEYGNYYAWGETQPKSVYTWDTYKWGYHEVIDGSRYRRASKYNSMSSCGIVDNKTELDLADDAAYVNWGSGWRMPSEDRFLELIHNCTRKWTTRNGVNGMLFTSNINGALLFLPAAGHRNINMLYLGRGYYWSRTLLGFDPFDAYSYKFASDNVGWPSYENDRARGHSVRAVRVSQN